MKSEYDFTKGDRGKFYDPNAVFNIPIYLEPDVDEIMHHLAVEKGIDLQELVNSWLRANIQLVQSIH